MWFCFTKMLFRTGFLNFMTVRPITFHPNYVSLKLHLLKSFAQFFYSSKTYIADELWFPIITRKPLDRFASKFDWEKQENCGNDWLKKSNLSGSTHKYKYINANCCKSATFLFEICKTTFYRWCINWAVIRITVINLIYTSRYNL